MRNVDAFAPGNLPDRLARLRGDHFSVESEQQLVSHRVMSLSASGHPGSQPFVQKELHGRDKSIRRRLSQCADRCVAHGLRKIAEKLLGPLSRLKQCYGLVEATPTRAALYARLVHDKY